MGKTRLGQQEGQAVWSPTDPHLVVSVEQKGDPLSLGCPGQPSGSPTRSIHYTSALAYFFLGMEANARVRGVGDYVVLEMGSKLPKPVLNLLNHLLDPKWEPF